MKINSFLKLVEIQTKVASVVPFLIGTFYALYTYDSFNFLNFLIMFLSLITFDMNTTAINNYIDYKSANKKEGFGYESHNAIVRDNIPERLVQVTIAALLSTAIILGLILVLRTNILVLIIGIVSFIIGILYTYGPVPISRTPLGELLSGFIMGFFIIFLAVYIHVYDTNIIIINFENWALNLNINLIELLKVFILSLPAQLGIYNLMLANNICDIDDDIENKRYTLPIYIGKQKALRLFSIVYLIVYGALILLIIFRIIPLISIITILTLIPVTRNIKKFNEVQRKDKTFELAVHNFLIINVTLAVSILLGVLF